ncbi:hypothetical protein [Nocardia grenadensis]|uniref:hypothetical protein n=1 Tax=Nocardia grenadensis TaxID=931537 RepID=UPI003D8A3FFF
MLTEQWLTAALCARHPQARVESFTLTAGSNGTSSRRGLAVRYNEVGAAARLPSELFTKSTAALTMRVVCGLCRLLGNESGFYRHIRPELELEAPWAYHAAFDPRSFRSLFVLEDVVATKGATFGNPLTRVLDKAMAEDMVGQPAIYHGAYWDSPRLRSDFGWLLTGEQWHTTMNSMINTGRMFRTGLARGAEVIPPELRGRQAGGGGPAVAPAGAETAVGVLAAPSWSRGPGGRVSVSIVSPLFRAWSFSIESCRFIDAGGASPVRSPDRASGVPHVTASQ